MVVTSAVPGDGGLNYDFEGATCSDRPTSKIGSMGYELDVHHDGYKLIFQATNAIRPVIPLLPYYPVTHANWHFGCMDSWNEVVFGPRPSAFCGYLSCGTAIHL